LDQMDDDDAASALRHMGEDQRAQLLAALPAQRAQELERWLARPAEAVAAPSPVRGKFRKVLSARRRAPS
jgi:flagellar motility protein MotE (MotC chaperone)